MKMDGVLKLYFGESNLPTPAYIKEAAATALQDGSGTGCGTGIFAPRRIIEKLGVGTARGRSEQNRPLGVIAC